MTLDNINRLIAEIAAAIDQAHIDDLLARNREMIDTLPRLERERALERIADVIREWRGRSMPRIEIGELCSPHGKAHRARLP